MGIGSIMAYDCIISVSETGSFSNIISLWRILWPYDWDSYREGYILMTYINDTFRAIVVFQDTAASLIKRIRAIALFVEWKLV